MGPAGLRAGGEGAHPELLPLLLLLLFPPSALGVTCPTPSAIEHADIRVKSYHQSSRERYTCHSGFKRKAGTSSLTECVYNETTGTARWTRPTLQCIRDPSLPQHQPPATSTAAPAVVTPKAQSPSKGASLPSHTPGTGSPELVTNASSLMPPGTPSAGPTSGVEQAPSSAPDVVVYNATRTTKLLLSATSVLWVLGLLLCVLCYVTPRWRCQARSPETENAEALPMRTVARGTEEDPENHAHALS